MAGYGPKGLRRGLLPATTTWDARRTHTLVAGQHIRLCICHGSDTMKSARSDKQPEAGNAEYDEEREGLLTGKEGFGEESDHEHKDVSRKWIYCLAAFLAVIMLGAVFVPPYFKPPQRRPVADFDSRRLRSNGTHDFRKTSLIVSIDGLRSVYLCLVLQNVLLTSSGQPCDRDQRGLPRSRPDPSPPRYQ